MSQERNNIKQVNIDWITKVFLINILWILFNLFGLIIFSFLPSTIAAYLLMINLVNKKEYLPVLSYWKVFKKEYFKSQIIFIYLTIIGFTLTFSLYFYFHNMSKSLIHLSLFFIILLLAILYIMTWVHIVPVYLHFPELKPFQVIRYAFLLAIGFLFHSLSLIVLNIILFLMFYYIWFLRMLIPALTVSTSIYLSYKIIANKYMDLIKDVEVLNIERYFDHY